jgi:hypothetical protein
MGLDGDVRIEKYTVKVRKKETRVKKKESRFCFEIFVCASDIPNLGYFPNPSLLEFLESWSFGDLLTFCIAMYVLVKNFKFIDYHNAIVG